MPKFQQGNPGGPGRPRGSRNKMNLLLDQIAEGEAERMLRKLIADADDGDRVSTRLVLNRIWSAPKGRAIALELPEIRAPRDLLAAHSAIASGLGDGTLTPQDAASLSSVLETHRRAFELVSQEARVEELETEVARLKANAQ
jgi:hypothetical protein